MKILLKKVICLFVLSFVLICSYWLLTDYSSNIYYGDNTEKQIRSSFAYAISDSYDCYFLGNSRIYRDINPDLFENMKAYNFAHDNDSFNQMYYKLLYLIDRNKEIKTVVIGVDYFQFAFLSDSRNYVYSSLFPKEYSEDYGISTNLQIIKQYFITRWSNKQNAIGSLIKLIKNQPKPKMINYLKTNGQYISYGQATGKETTNRDYTITDVQYRYYKKILELCEMNNFQLYIIMPPLWESELKGHSEEERHQFDNMIMESIENTPFSGNYMNYLNEEGISQYSDFIDITHLTPEAADKYSDYLNQRIKGSK